MRVPAPAGGAAGTAARLALRTGLTLLLLALLSLPAAALDLEAELGTDGVAEALPPAASAALEGLEVSGVTVESGLARIWAMVRERFHSALTEALRPAAAVAAIVLLCSLLDQFPGPGDFDFVQLGGCLAVAALSLGDLQSAMALGSATLDELGEFSHVLLPALTTAAISGGAITSAGAKYAAAALFSDLLLTAAQNLILPMLTAIAATSAAGAALGTKQLQGVEKLLTWLGRSLLKYLTLGFTAYLGFTGVLSGSADAAAVKAARSVLSTALPVVGRMLSDASASLVAGVGMLRSALGVFGALGVVAAVALPLLRLGLRCLLFRAAAALGGVVAGERMGRLLTGIGNVYAMLMGLVGTGAVILLLSIISLVRTVTG